MITISTIHCLTDRQLLQNLHDTGLILLNELDQTEEYKAAERLYDLYATEAARRDLNAGDYIDV